jgi:4-carboxymuconolactone decarboxylase
MSRIPLKAVDEVPDDTREFIIRRGGLNVFRLLANAPGVFLGWTELADALLDSPTFTLRTRELVILRVAHLQQSAYQVAQHTDVARRAGLGLRQIHAILGDEPLTLTTGVFDAGELAILNFVTEICTGKSVSTRTFETVKSLLGADGVVELLMLIGFYYGLALVLNATELDIDDVARLKV